MTFTFDSIGVEHIGSVHAGFPSPAADYEAHPLSLDKFLMKNPAATFILRNKGSGMSGEGIRDGDLLIVDRSLKPVSGCLAVIYYSGKLMLRKLLFSMQEEVDLSIKSVSVGSLSRKKNCNSDIKSSVPFFSKNQRITLVSFTENQIPQKILIKKDEEISIWGVVRCIIRDVMMHQAH